MIFSRHFAILLVSDIGLYEPARFDGLFGLIFHFSGTTPLVSDSLKITSKSVFTFSGRCFICSNKMLSSPGAFLVGS